MAPQKSQNGGQSSGSVPALPLGTQELQITGTERSKGQPVSEWSGTLGQPLPLSLCFLMCIKILEADPSVPLYFLALGRGHCFFAQGEEGVLASLWRAQLGPWLKGCPGLSGGFRTRILETPNSVGREFLGPMFSSGGSCPICLLVSHCLIWVFLLSWLSRCIRLCLVPQTRP